MPRSGLLLHLVLLLAFGVLVPLMKGLDFLDPLLLSAYTVIPPLLAVPMASSGGGTRSAALRSTAWATGLFAVMLVAGFATVNGARRYGGVVLPSTPVLAAVALLGASLALFAAFGTALLSRRGVQAQRWMRMAFLLLLVGVIAWQRFAPWAWRDLLLSAFEGPRFLLLSLTLSAALLLAGVGMARRLRS